MDWLKKQENRSYLTYKARVRAANRLKARGTAWSTFLVSSSTASTIASIVVIQDSNFYGQHGPVLLAAIAVLTLVASLVVTGVNYDLRQREMFDNYRKIQKLSVEIELLISKEGGVDYAKKTELMEKYQELLDGAENHSEVDYQVAIRSGHGEKSTLRGWSLFKYFTRLIGQAALTYVPYVIVMIPLAVLVPVIGLVW